MLALASRIGSRVDTNGMQMKIALSFGVYLLPGHPIDETELVGALDKANIA